MIDIYEKLIDMYRKNKIENIEYYVIRERKNGKVAGIPIKVPIEKIGTKENYEEYINS